MTSIRKDLQECLFNQFRGRFWFSAEKQIASGIVVRIENGIHADLFDLVVDELDDSIADALSVGDPLTEDEVVILHPGDVRLLRKEVTSE